MRTAKKSTRRISARKPSRPRRGEHVSPKHATRDSQTGKIIREIVVRYEDTFRALSKK